VEAVQHVKATKDEGAIDVIELRMNKFLRLKLTLLEEVLNDMEADLYKGDFELKNLNLSMRSVASTR
jgi:hypothetical protein